MTEEGTVWELLLTELSLPDDTDCIGGEGEVVEDGVGEADQGKGDYTLCLPDSLKYLGEKRSPPIENNVLSSTLTTGSGSLSKRELAIGRMS